MYQWLEGETATRHRIADPGEAATRLARFVAALQRIDAGEGPPPGGHNWFKGEPLANRDDATRKAIAALRSRLGALLGALPYYRDTNPAFARMARRTIAEVLADHAPTSR